MFNAMKCQPLAQDGADGLPHDDQVLVPVAVHVCGGSDEDLGGIESNRAGIKQLSEQGGLREDSFASVSAPALGWAVGRVTGR